MKPSGIVKLEVVSNTNLGFSDILI
ncbi:MAG: hypothetical protein K940chlam2_01522, partial [Chlamydiae bacterium]|nr:hypothetical protein [Chlamydiota bacterium]